MIAVSEATRTAIDAAVERALARLSKRAARHGDAAAALSDAAAAAAEGGKRLRPALVVAAFEAFGGDVDIDDDRSSAVWDVAAAYELLHTAFVVHDDLIDHDIERRGEPNVAGRFRLRAHALGADGAQAAQVGDAAGVLAGDLLLFEAARLVSTTRLPDGVRRDLFEILDDAILVSAVGELADVENAAQTDVPPTVALLDAAHDKTAAYSFTAPLLAGAALADAPPAARDALAAASADLGLAFQLVDDLIGSFGTRGQAGRDPGADLREAKRTPLIALARHSGSWPRVRSALALAHTGPVAVRRAQRELEASGARDELVVVVEDLLRRARAHASSPQLPAAAVALLADIAVAIERRIP